MSKQLGPAEVELPSDSEVRVERTFAADRETVYRAFTEPELVRQWLLGPPGWSMTVCEMDVRVGGGFRWRWRSEEDGSEFGFSGEFLRVERPSVLRHTEVFDPGDTDDDMGSEPALVTITFSEDDGSTKVTTLIDYGSRASRDEALSSGMTDGMEMSYSALDGLLQEGGSS